MRRSMFKSKLHRVRVTEADLDYEGSISIDEDLMEAADIVAHEHVHFWNVSNGERLETYAIPGPRGSGVICLNGSAARKAQRGDIGIIATFSEVDDAEVDLKTWSPTVILVDEKNQIKSISGGEKSRAKLRPVG